MIFNIHSSAKDLFFNNKKSGLKAKDIQDAIDEVSSSLANGCVKFQVTTDGKLQYSVYTE